MQRKIKHLRDLNTLSSNEDPVSRGVSGAYSIAYRMVDKLANELYHEGITQEEPEDG
jgi:hypothetical protein